MKTNNNELLNAVTITGLTTDGVDTSIEQLLQARNEVGIALNLLEIYGAHESVADDLVAIISEIGVDSNNFLKLIQEYYCGRDVAPNFFNEFGCTTIDVWFDGGRIAFSRNCIYVSRCSVEQQTTGRTVSIYLPTSGLFVHPDFAWIREFGGEKTLPREIGYVRDLSHKYTEAEKEEF